ncbi:MAG TPA: hypothetical protein DCP06_03435 [Lachnospiraceae bacterium]|nr:hypothetical protein [Lachnospiraceae bacterium]
MKGMTKRIIAVCMTFVILSVTPLNDIAPKEISKPATAMAAEDDKGGKYVSEVRIGQGETEEKAKKELEEGGYTILKDDAGNYADLNEGAGSKSELKTGANDKKVYLGYKTTSDPKKAITDLATINMGTPDNAPYSETDYNVLMKKTMDSHIKPFVNNFIAALEEYRENYNKPKDTLNHIRADYMRRILNKFTDDDTGKPMGDLLLNKTKYEMGDAAYNALSDSEKKDHADILTILMQANGQATLAIETLITKATDTSDDTWIDRFTSTSLSELEDRMREEQDFSNQNDLNAALDKKYNDTATELLKKWDAFREDITDYEDKADEIEDSTDDLEDMVDEIESMDLQNTTDTDEEKISEAANEVTKHAIDGRAVGVAAYLEGINYNGSSLLDYFSREYDEVKTNSGIRTLYPIVDALSPGQIAGLEFMSFMDLVSIAMADKDTYADVEKSIETADPVSVYDGVDREIYEEGGVAMTTDALRKQASQNVEPENYNGTLPIMLWSIVIGFAAASIGVKALANVIFKFEVVKWVKEAYEEGVKVSFSELSAETIHRYNLWKSGFGNTYGQYLSAGLATLAVIMTILSLIVTLIDISSYYSTKYLPIPNIMVDVNDITTKDENGDDILIKNQTAYYRAVRCNRKAAKGGIEKNNYDAMGDKADLNGDIGRQWLALYAVKNENGRPILSDSFRYVKGSDSVPEGYRIGIHEFGTFNKKGDSAPAFNLNNSKYLFAGDPPSIKVYYKIEDKTVTQLTSSKAGSIFSVGSLALGGGFGIIIGALFMGLIMRRRRPTEERAL